MSLSLEVHSLTPDAQRALLEGTPARAVGLGEPVEVLLAGCVPRGSAARPVFVEILRRARTQAQGTLAARLSADGFLESYHPRYLSMEEAAAVLAVDSGHPGVWFLIDERRAGQPVRRRTAKPWRVDSFERARSLLADLPDVLRLLDAGVVETPQTIGTPADDIVMDFRAAAETILAAQDDLFRAPEGGRPRFAPHHAYALESLVSVRALDEKRSRVLVLLLSLLSTHEHLASSRAVHAALDYSLLHRVDVRAPDPWDLRDLGIGPWDAIPALIEDLVEIR